MIQWCEMFPLIDIVVLMVSLVNEIGCRGPMECLRPKGTRSGILLKLMYYRGVHGETERQNKIVLAGRNA
jgi:hypothetical protein